MEETRRPSALQTILGMFRLSNTPTIAIGEDEIAADADEPPDQVTGLHSITSNEPRYTRAMILPPNIRRESLLTRAITSGTQATDAIPISHPISNAPRALSTASSQSVPSTADLTSDGELTSPNRSASPSPPAPATCLLPIKAKPVLDTNLPVPPTAADVKPDVAVVGEAAVEKTLGRKRCIMFACSEKPKAVEPAKESPVTLPAKTGTQIEPQPRKYRLTFACPTRQDSNTSLSSKTTKLDLKLRSPSPAPKSTVAKPVAGPTPESGTISVTTKSETPTASKPILAPITKPSQPFHEFGSSQDETDSWVNNKSVEDKPKLTLQDVMKKEIAIRKIGEEAEEEADEEQREQAELDEDLEDENEVEDDFAPSDEDESDGGNESDDEGGFADSDEESDAGSEYQFWAPSTTTAATSSDNLTHFSLRQQSRSSSLDSRPSQATSPPPAHIFHPRHSAKSKAIKMRPGTPELPDSTDFVCGTLDEDRPLEAAFISCREQKKREKQILIPQDIDPSFPTTDPEDEGEEDLDEGESEPVWLRDQFGAMDDDTRGGRRPSAIRITSTQGVTQIHQPQIHHPQPIRPAFAAPSRRNTNRSPAPTRLRSPPPRRLFGQSPSRMRSPPPPGRYRSPRGSPTNMKMPLGITINRLAQKPSTDRTASLPHTPNPFFRNWKRGSPPTSRIPSGAVTPGSDEAVRSDLHVRGPVDIVIGLEKKRQKRKEKFWRQHCRKAAKEQSERKPVPGRGVERMKELGLECAERTRAYGLGQQQAKLVLSL